MRLPALTRRSPFWFGAFVVWFAVLWLLSSGPLPGPRSQSLPFLDKLMHFGYFFGGAGLLSAALYLRARAAVRWDVLHLVVIVVLTAVGALDEWHQSWSPFRSGNDAGDLAADVFGAVAGTLVFRRLCHLLAPGDSRL